MATFSDRMIAKYGAKRWAGMNAEVNAYQNQEMVVIKGSDLLNHSVTALLMTGNSYTGELDKIAEEKAEEVKLTSEKTRKVINFHSPAVLEAVKMIGFSNEITLEGIVKDFENTLTYEKVRVSDKWLQSVKKAILNHFTGDEIEAAMAKDFN